LSGRCHAGLAFAFYVISLLASLLALYQSNHADNIPTSSALGLFLVAVLWLIPFVSVLITGWGANRSLIRAKRERSRLYANLSEAGQIALFATGVPVILFCLGAQLPYSVAALSNEARMLHGPLWHVRLDHTVLRVSGEFTGGIADAVETDLSNTDPAVRIVVFNSPGGDIEEAIRIGNAIKRHGVATGVSAECDSACTYSFIAGRERILLPPARLGFHACHKTVWFVDCRNDRYIAYLTANGVQEQFIRRALAVNPHDIWFPTPSELLAANVITATTIEGHR
jgi:hypothetical protein